jgi:Fur family transcriptional regulator, ferric uptake regulator
MTLPSSAEADFEHARKILREAGMRCTAARLWVMQMLTDSKSPLSHAQVADVLSPKGFDRATIYRNLIELADAGLVSRIELGDHVWRFELKRPNHLGATEHPHFVCIDCGTVTCMPEVSFQLPKATESSPDTQLNVTEVLLKGHCGHCETA